MTVLLNGSMLVKGGKKNKKQIEVQPLPKRVHILKYVHVQSSYSQLAHMAYT